MTPTERYAFLDSLELTRVIGRWEVGGGPTLKRNDRLGVWAVSARFGDHAELRLVRTLTF